MKKTWDFFFELFKRSTRKKNSHFPSGYPSVKQSENIVFSSRLKKKKKKNTGVRMCSK